MILACIQGKTQYHRRFQPKHLDEYSTERRRTQEDELTSIVFGTFRYLSPTFVAKVAAMMLRESGLSGKVDDAWVSGSISLWERREGTEPDVILRLINQRKETFTLIVEVKWFAGEGDSQLEREWNWLTQAERKSAAIIFLSKKPAESIEESSTPRSQSLGFLTWLQFAAMLRRMEFSWNEEAELHWLDDLIAFLSMIGLASFKGFDQFITLGDGVVDAQNPRAIFYEGFGGFEALHSPSDVCASLPSPHFWQEQ